MSLIYHSIERFRMKQKKLIQEVPDGAGLVFTDIQYELFSKLISSREFSFSGPTSMGKVLCHKSIPAV